MKIRTAVSILRHDYRLRRGKKVAGLPAAHSNQLFFRDGWGDEQILGYGEDLFLKTPSVPQIEWEKTNGSPSVDGFFASPLAHPWLPPESRQARVRLFLPKGSVPAKTPLCLCFSMTGDEGFEVRTRTFALPLLKMGIGVLLLENPYYGQRRPADQSSYFLRRVHDMLVMSVAAVEEGRALVEWAFAEGYRQVGVAGVSQGGMVAGAVGALSPYPLAIAASLAAHSPDVIFTEGLLQGFVDWRALGPDREVTAFRLREVFSAGNLATLPSPVYAPAAVLLGARKDRVVPRYSVSRIHQRWEGSRLKWLPGTHVTSIALHERAFRSVVAEAFGALAKR